MCRMSSYGYEKRPGDEPTRSFFEALRDLFRRAPRPQAEAEVVPLPAVREAAQSAKADRPKAA